jgi:dTDP-4-amino-4,6-dideoxygalactose transaminase
VAWSFQAIKHLTTTDGGALLVPQKQFRRARLLRWYGLDRESGAADYRCEQDITEAGYKYHMSNVTAAQGLGNLPYVRDNISRHRENAEYYNQALRGTHDIQTPGDDPMCSWWLYTLLVRDPMALRAYLKERGIDASPVHKRNDVHTCFRQSAKSTYDLPGVDRFSSRELAIPVGWWVTDDERRHIAQSVLAWAEQKVAVAV